ncbi:MAG: HEAT repeat domain-containing protein [Planctomycetes bacterium]|nr:HEAT repeat domain-containing protein [Planctomycetota bacterium]
MFSSLRACVCSSNAQTRQNTLAIVRRSSNPRLAYLATHAIHDGSQKIRAEAAEAILEMTQKHIAARAETIESLRDTLCHNPDILLVVTEALRVLAEEHKYLVTALREALEHYESHHRPEVVEAAMLLASDLESSLFDQATLKRGKLTHAMFDILSGDCEPRFVPFLYIAMCHPEMRRRLVPKISACRDRAFFAEFIRSHWMTRDPSIRKNLVYIRSIDWLDDGFEAAFNLPPDVATMMPGWLLSLGLPAGQKVALLLNCLIVDNPAANRAAVWALVELDTPASTVALESIAGHENPSLGRIAQMELQRRSRLGRQVQKRPETRGRPDEWVALLERSNLKEDFEEFWQNFEHIQPALARSTGHYALKYISGFSNQLQSKLLSQNAADRFRAIRLALTLNIARQFERDIFASANDRTPEIRAEAMSALGQLGGETSRRILERGLGDAIDSVQAAAINALDAMGSKRRDELVLPKIDSDNADVRAAAVRCLLKMRVPASAAALIQMMSDPRSDHRCAALWIVDQLRLATIAPRVLKIAQNDPDPRIARIAMHVAGRLQRDPAQLNSKPEEAGALPRQEVTA